jgi:hypothetical protein
MLTDVFTESAVMFGIDLPILHFLIVSSILMFALPAAIAVGWILSGRWKEKTVLRERPISEHKDFRRAA